jgi:hypothetical protein
MKLENNQSYVTNLQFSGGWPVGSGSLNSATIARGNVEFSSSLASTGSFKVTNPLGTTTNYFLTASVSASDATNQSAGSNQYIAVSGSNGEKLAIISSVLTANTGLFLNATGSGTTLAVSASFGGSNGNDITFLIATGSAFNTYKLASGTGKSNWPYSFPFVAQGLYVGVAGDLNGTTIDGSYVSFTSASGFIPGLFTSVSGSSTALAVLALK